MLFRSGLYSVIGLVGFVLIVRGWKAVGAGDPLYSTGDWALPAAYGLMVTSFILFTAAYTPAGRIKSAVGHPMVLGLILFSAGHLLVNSDPRSVIVFGSFLAYGLLDRVAVSMRGERGTQGTSVAGDAAAIGAGLVSAFIVVHFLHPYIAGVALEPGQVFGN